jgi:hypothetical protein
MSKSRVLGCDPGTMFFQVAESDAKGSVSLKAVRNAFVELPVNEDVEENLSNNGWQWIKDGNHYYVIGEDSLRVANMLPDKVELRRPMQEGVLNKGEDKKMLIMSEIIRMAVGEAPDDKSVLCTCVSSEPVDGSVDSVFHRARLMGMFSRLGWNVKVIDEGLAVVLSERPTMKEVDDDGKEVEIPFSGIGCSFGAGRTNCVLARKGWQALGLSCARGGDWIDRHVSEATGTAIGQVTRKKEKKLDFDQIDYEDDVIFALNTYYDALISFVFGKFAKQFATVKSDFESPLEVVVAGGTSMPKGFCNKIKEVIDKLDLPFEVSEVKHANDPRNVVVKGCLMQGMISKKRLDKGESIGNE